MKPNQKETAAPPDGDRGETSALNSSKEPPTYGSAVVDDIESLESILKPRPTAKSLAEQSLVHPIVNTIEEIPEVCRGKYMKDGKVFVPTAGVAVKVISVSKLNLADNTFDADFNVNVAWVGGPMDGPDLSFYNIVEEGALERVPTPPEEEEDEDGKPVKWNKGKKGMFDGVTRWDYYYRIRIRGTFRQQYELTRFPFDRQDLAVYLHMTSECNLVPLRWSLDGESCTCDPRAVSEEFKLVGADVSYTYMPSYKFGKIDGYDPEAKVTFSIIRKPTFWVVSYGLVASLVCTLMACTYAIPARMVGERLASATMLVLTMTATKYLMQEKLPAVPYFTLLDIHIVFCCIALMLLTAQIGVTGLIGWREMEHLEYVWLPWVGFFWLCYHVFVLAFVFCG